MSGSRFSLPFATIVFGDDADDQRRAIGVAAVKRFKIWLDGAQRGDLHRACALIDARLVSSLGPAEMLEVARLIEARAPEVIDNMPRLRDHREQLDRAYRMAQVFNGPTLTSLIVALRQEGAR